MREAYAATGLATNSRGHKTAHDLAVMATELSARAALTAVLKIKESRKTWAFLADLLSPQIEISESVAKHRLRGSRDYTSDEIRKLLQSEEGLEFLVALMADAEPKWWWWAKQVMSVASIKRRRKEDEQEILRLETSAPAEPGARRRIKGALDANRSISAAIDRAEIALGYGLSNVAGGNGDGAGSAHRAPHRAMAPGRGQAGGRR